MVPGSGTYLEARSIIHERDRVARGARHARATVVRIRLRQSGAWVELSITDDGVGLPGTVAGTDKRSFGVRGMRERLRLVDGEFALEPGPNGGTRVRARFPIASS